MAFLYLNNELYEKVIGKTSHSQKLKENKIPRNKPISEGERAVLGNCRTPKEVEGEQSRCSSNSHITGSDPSIKYQPNTTGIYHKIIKYPGIESEKSLHNVSYSKQNVQHKTLLQIKL